MTVRVKNMGRIVDARVKLGRYRVRDSHVVRLQKLYGFPQLSVVGELQSKRGAFRMRAETENFPEREREKRQRVMLRVAAQEQAAVPVPDDFLGQREAQGVTVKYFGGFEILHEKIDRPEAHSLEGTRQQNAIYIPVVPRSGVEGAAH